MSRWTSLAGRQIKQYSSPNIGGAMTAHRGIVLHHAEGGYAGTIGWQLNPDQRYSSGESVTTSSTWVVGKEPGEWAQLVDTDMVAWCQRSGSYQWNSIELAGYHTEALTAWQIEACAQLLAEYHRRYGIPLQVTSDTGSYGLGHHSMDDDLRVEWGHDDCPGAQTIAAKAQIVARAVAIINGEEPDMTPEQAAELHEVYLAVTQGLRSGPNQTAAGGVPIAWLPRQFYEVDHAVATIGTVTSTLQAAQARIEAKLAELAAAEQDDSPAGGVSAAQIGDIVDAELREAFGRAAEAPTG